MPTTIGYCRVSTTDQVAGLEAQQRDLKAIGCEIIFSEMVSSVADVRSELNKALARLQPGDVLVVTKPDRLARSTIDLLRIVEDLTKRDVGLVILSMGGEKLDTRNATSKLMLTILAGVATWEREIMKERQREGIAKAKADGKYKSVGRKKLPREAIDSVLAGGFENKSADEMAAELGVSRRTFFRAKKERELNEINDILSTPELRAA